MKLEFEQHIVPEGLQKELGFDDYLSLFDADLPLLSHVVLRPLKCLEGEVHFLRLLDLEKHIEQAGVLIDKLVEQSRKLPRLDYLLPCFENQTLEQYHLFHLGTFLAENEILQELENSFPAATASGECCTIRNILEVYTQNGFASLRCSPEGEKLRQWIIGLEKELETALSRYEDAICDQTGIKMVYPYPKEVSLEERNLTNIEDSGLLTLVRHQDAYLIGYRLPLEVEEIVQKKDGLNQRLNRLMDNKLQGINEELKPYFRAFADDYLQRKRRTLDYAILRAKKNHALCFPLFRPVFGCRLNKAVLPQLKNQKKHKYVPLSLELHQGSNVLVGANITGKTTTLKTLYFHLTAIRMGLPVPAEKIELHFPEQVEIKLKSSGSIQSSLSGFGEELQFFTKTMEQSAYVLVDELFQSTDPVSGTELSTIFLEEFSQRNALFFCTSHYPELVHLPGISLFRMKDMDFEGDCSPIIDLHEFMNQIPFQVEEISRDNIDNFSNKKWTPLRLALHFPLPKSVQEKIYKILNVAVNCRANVDHGNNTSVKKDPSSSRGQDDHQKHIPSRLL